MFVLDLVSDMEGTVSSTGGVSKDVDENICTLKELKYIETSFKTKRVLMSEGDFSKIVERITKLSSSSGGGAVSSVNGEIGDVVIDASEIELLDGTAKEIWELEHKVKRSYKKFSYTPNNVFAGHTECYGEEGLESLKLFFNKEVK